MIRNKFFGKPYKSIPNLIGLQNLTENLIMHFIIGDKSFSSSSLKCHGYLMNAGLNLSVFDIDSYLIWYLHVT
jgi:hypothetical protein